MTAVSIGTGTVILIFINLINSCLAQDRSDFQTCSCDLTASVCDLSCCCDPDCTQETLTSWRTNLKICLTEINPTTDNCFSDSIVYRINQRKGIEEIKTTERGKICVRGIYTSSQQDTLSPKNLTEGQIVTLSKQLALQLNFSEPIKPETTASEKLKLESLPKQAYLLSDNLRLADGVGSDFLFYPAQFDGLKCGTKSQNIVSNSFEEKLFLNTNTTLRCNFDTNNELIQSVCTSSWLKERSIFSFLFDEAEFRYL